ncbi:hypothetical protein HZS_6197, partial [Henneguya salminicola]
MKIWMTFSAKAAGFIIQAEGNRIRKSTGNMKQASYAEVWGWISETWTSVTNECVKNGFRKALYETGKEYACDTEDDSERVMTKTRVWRL